MILGALRIAQLLAFAGVSVHTVRGWRRRRTAATGWLAANFLILTGLITMGFLPKIGGNRGFGMEVLVRLIIAALLFIPYGFYLFTDGFRPRRRWQSRLVLGATFLVIAPLTLGPALPGPEDPKPVWLAPFSLLIAAHWTALTVIAACRLWREGRGQPRLARRRMSTLALGCLIINVSILFGFVFKTKTSSTELSSQIIGLTSALVFYFGYVVPAPMRAWWRRPEMEAFRRGEVELMLATTRDAVADAVVPHAAALIGGGIAIIADRDRRPIGSGYGPAHLALLAYVPESEVDAGTVTEVGDRVVTFALSDAWLVIETSSSAPFFGREELDLLDGLGHLIDLALQRAALFDRVEEAVTSLTENERQLSEAQHVASIGSFELDRETQATIWSDELLNIFDLDEEQRGDLEAWLARVHPDDRERIRQAALGPDNDIETEYRLVRRDGETRHIRAGAHLVTRPDGSTRIVGIVQDVTERLAAEQQLSHGALHDPLTDLPNRVLLMDRLDQAIARRARTGFISAALFIDIDRFKSVNDGFGHRAGDDLLKAVAARLLDLIRPGDTVARIGGDEFVVLAECVESEAGAWELAERLRASLSEPTVIGDRVISITVSIGVAVDDGEADGGESMLRDADQAMYRAKSLGRARSELFDAALRSEFVRRVETEHELRYALDHGQLVLHFQPCISLAAGDIVGVEALVRWNHPTRGLLLPSEFVPLAEHCGLVVQLGTWALREACRFGELMYERLGASMPTVWLNVSAHQLQEGTLAPLVAGALRDSGFPAARLGIELTESALMDTADAAEELAQVRALGVHLALDDFGTGFSSLSYLRRFPFDLLKIDKSFVAGIGFDVEDTAIVSACVALAHSLGMPCVAEGVESPEQLEALRVLGCDLAQGYLFSRAVPYEDLARVMERLGPNAGGMEFSERPRVLVCDDEPSVRLLLRVGLEAEGAEVVEVSTAEACLKSAEAHQPDLVLLDVMMPGQGGMWALERLHATLPNVPVMLVTASSSASVVERGRTLGAKGCLDKVGILDHLSELLTTVDRAKRTRVA